jgi:tripartite-type tricarboxylate transporter receptor subunit TctC
LQTKRRSEKSVLICATGVNMKIWFGWFCKFAVLCAIAGGVNADSPYPVRPVTIVVAAPPGGQTDVVTRVVAQQLSIQLGQPVVIENKSGATGNIGTAYVARATPDGYTLVVVPTAYTANPSVIRDMPFDAVKDFKMIVHMTSNPNVLVVNVDSQYHSLQDIIRAAKASPGALTYGDVGPGSTMSLFMEKLKALTKIAF